MVNLDHPQSTKHAQGELKARLACRLAGPALALTLLSGCVYLPETTVRFNPECGSYERKMVMHPHQIGTLMGCRDEGCVAGLLAFGAISAASAVVAGSVVIVGNVVYWLEKRAHCPNPAPTPLPTNPPTPDASGAPPAK